MEIGPKVRKRTKGIALLNADRSKEDACSPGRGTGSCGVPGVVTSKKKEEDLPQGKNKKPEKVPRQAHLGWGATQNVP